MKSQKMSKEDFQALSSFFSRKEFSSEFFSKSIEYDLSFNKGKLYFNKIPNFIWPRVKFGYEDNLKELHKEKFDLQEKFKIFDSIKIDIVESLSVGEQFPILTDVYSIDGDCHKESTLEINEGQITLIEYWGRWY